MAEGQLLRLRRSQRKPLREALMSAYRSEGKLKLMLLEEMEIRLNDEVGGDNYAEKVGNLVDWAEEEGRLAELINVAYQRNPGNPDLKQFLESFNIVPAATLQPSAFGSGWVKSPDFTWRGPEQERELQGFWRPEPELWDVAFLNKGIRQVAAVCLIELAGQGAIATGFLIKKDLLLTNYHVLAPEPDADPTHFLADITLRFTHLPLTVDTTLEEQTFKLANEPILKYSPTHQLDYVLLRVENKILDNKNIYSVNFSPQKAPAKNAGINLLQHPAGQSIKLALSSNGVTGVYQAEGLIQYVSRTAPGSSGSPCFDDDWQVVALHHAQKAGAFGVICEGILLNAIYPEIAAFL